MTSNKLRILITGASGLLGRTLCREAENYGFEVTGLAFSRVTGNFIKCDIRNSKEVESIIDQIKPDFIVHSAAERFPDKIENDFENAKNLNVNSSKHLAYIAKQKKCRLIYISTDYVFDGKSSPYDVDATPNPLNKYGQTKLDGENAILEVNEDACILRIPILYGNVERLEESAVTTLLNLLFTKELTKVSHYEKRYPSHTRDISKIICDLINAINKDNSVRGIFHWSGKQCMTKYDILLIIAKTFMLTIDHIRPITEASPSGTNRPYNARLDCSRLKNLNIDHHTEVSAGLKEVLNQWVPS